MSQPHSNTHALTVRREKKTKAQFIPSLEKELGCFPDMTCLL